jgi:hypothetical protein
MFPKGRLLEETKEGGKEEKNDRKWVIARHWWLTPVILAKQEAEIRRIMVRRQPRQIVHEPLSQKTVHKSRTQGKGPGFKLQYCKINKQIKEVSNNEIHQICIGTRHSENCWTKQGRGKRVKKSAGGG